MKYTVITNDGSKWLRRYHPDEVIYGEPRRYTLVPYIGSHPEGTTVDEGEVKLKRQYQDVDTGQWFDIKDEAPNLVKDLVRVYREAYTDAEPGVTRKQLLSDRDEWLRKNGHLLNMQQYGHAELHLKSDASKENIGEASYWKTRCEAAEKFIAKSPCDPDIYEEQMIAYHEWQSIVNKEPK